MSDRVLAAPDPDSTLRAVRGPRGLWLTSARRIRSDPTAFAQALRHTHGDIAYVTALGRDVVIAQGPQAAAELLGNRDHAFVSEPVYRFALGRIFERGLLLMDGDTHHRHRRLMQHAFTGRQLSGYAERLHPLVESAVGRFPVGPGVDVRVPLKAISLDVALEIFVGERLSRADADRVNAAFVDLIEAAGAVIRLRLPFTRWGRATKAKRVVDELFAELVPRRRRQPGSDLMSALCTAEPDEGERLTDAEIVDHMRFMLFAAHDTATVAMTAMIYQLGRHPQWRERVRAESAALGAYPGLSELRSATALDAVFRESMRLRPPVPVIARAAHKDTELCGRFIPQGAFVVTLTGANHRLADVWPDPDRFDPGRFIDPAGRRDSPRMAWMPFGGGAHACIGMHFAYLEAATVIHHLVRARDWTVPTDDFERNDAALVDNHGCLADVYPIADQFSQTARAPESPIR